MKAVEGKLLEESDLKNIPKNILNKINEHSETVCIEKNGNLYCPNCFFKINNGKCLNCNKTYKQNNYNLTIVDINDENYVATYFSIVYFEKEKSNLIINNIIKYMYADLEEKRLSFDITLERYEIKDKNVYDLLSGDYVLENGIFKMYPSFNSIDYIDEESAYLVNDYFKEDVNVLNEFAYKGNINLFSFIFSLVGYNNFEFLRNKGLIYMAYTPIIDFRDKDIVKIIELNDEEINFARKYNLSSSEVLHLKKYKIYNMEWLSILETIDYRFIGFIRDTYFSIYEDLKYKHVRNIENSVIYPFLNSINYVKVKERFDKGNIQISVETLLEYLNAKFKEEKLDEKIKELVYSSRLNEKIKKIGGSKMGITVENLVKVFYDKEKVACPITEKLIKAGYQQLSDGYIANAKKCGIEVDYSKALPTQWWHLIESYCNFSGKCPYEGKRNFAQIRCGELIVWMAEVLDCVDKKELEKLVDDIISKPIDYKGSRPIYKNCNDRIKALCYDKIEKEIELLCKD